MAKSPTHEMMEKLMNSDQFADRKRGYLAYYEDMAKNHQKFIEAADGDRKYLDTNSVTIQAEKLHEQQLEKFRQEMQKIGIKESEIEKINTRYNL